MSELLLASANAVPSTFRQAFKPHGVSINIARYLLYTAALSVALVQSGNASTLTQSDVESLTESNGRIGITFEDRVITRHNMSVFAAVITEVSPQSSFYGRGLDAGDLVYEVQGYNFESAPALLKFVGAMQPGRAVNIRFFDHESGRDRELDGRLIAASVEPEQSAASSPQPSADSTFYDCSVEAAKSGALRWGMNQVWEYFGYESGGSATDTALQTLGTCVLNK